VPPGEPPLLPEFAYLIPLHSSDLSLLGKPALGCPLQTEEITSLHSPNTFYLAFIRVLHSSNFTVAHVIIWLISSPILNPMSDMRMRFPHLLLQGA